MERTKWFDGETDRYTFDFGACSIANRFAQVDTSQDASYYGIWANPFSLTVVSYTEGDIVVAKAADKQEFVAELAKIKAWDEKISSKSKERFGVDCGWKRESLLRAEFVWLGLGGLLH
jgi:hypothetical protein